MTREEKVEKMSKKSIIKSKNLAGKKASQSTAKNQSKSNSTSRQKNTLNSKKSNKAAANNTPAKKNAAQKSQVRVRNNGKTLSESGRVSSDLRTKVVKNDLIYQLNNRFDFKTSTEERESLSQINNHKMVTVKSASSTKRKGWTLKRRKEVQLYVENLMIIMRLKDWKLLIDWEDLDDDDFYATMQSQPDQMRSTLSIKNRFLELSREEQTQTLVHELVHCHLFALHYMAERAMEESVGSKAFKIFEVALDCEVEKATDILADIIVPFVPLLNLS